MHEEGLTKEQKIQVVIALSSTIIAFVGIIGLVLALSEFIELRFKIFGFGGASWIITIFGIGLCITFILTKRWMLK